MARHLVGEHRLPAPSPPTMVTALSSLSSSASLESRTSTIWSRWSSTPTRPGGRASPAARSTAGGGRRRAAGTLLHERHVVGSSKEGVVVSGLVLAQPLARHVRATARALMESTLMMTRKESLAIAHRFPAPWKEENSPHARRRSGATQSVNASKACSVS